MIILLKRVVDEYCSMVYICKRCGRSWQYKYLLERHLSRKNPCEPKVESIDTCVLLDELADKRELRYKCKHCDKLYADKQSKYVHQRSCTASGRLEILSQTVVALQSELAALKMQPGYINNGTINNTQIHIQNLHIHTTQSTFGCENTSYIDQETLYVSFRDKDLLKVIEEIHFHPENHNVRVKNAKKNTVETISNGQWVTQNKKYILPKLVVNGCKVLDAYRKENSKMLMDEVDDYYETLVWLRSLYTLDKDMFKRVKQRIYDFMVEHKATALSCVG